MVFFHVYVPEENKEAVKEACFAAGAGQFEHYAKACWETRGSGQFLPLEGANPHIGETGRLERLEEYRIEFIASDENAAAVARALVEAHPYEEPAWGAFRMADADELLADESAWL
jgi:hypothetical protein